MKRIKITEAVFREIVNEQRIPDYFKPEVKNGKITLYHGLSNDSLDYVLSVEELTPKTCSEGCFGLWFSIDTERDYPSGYSCLISIDVPIEDIGSGRRFSVMNTQHLLTEKPISVNEYNFNVLKINGLTLDDERLEYWHELLNENPAKFTKILGEFCYGDATHYYVLGRLEKLN